MCWRTVADQHFISIFFAEYWPLVQEEEVQSRWQRAAHDMASTKTWKRKRQRSRSSHDCHLERRQMRVRDLGLGYDSDEIILFKYCVGTCLSSRKNYDLALKALMENRSISSNKVSGQPCCRPVRYEAVSFMDAQTTWQTIKWLSATNCSCVGWWSVRTTHTCRNTRASWPGSM